MNQEGEEPNSDDNELSKDLKDKSNVSLYFRTRNVELGCDINQWYLKGTLKVNKKLWLSIWT